ncbi:MAG: hypothetical protein GF401_09725 [Chitinivibrionales bacterium]|nr:hypothetical protein [Chitinivibrionales bacterium]
MIPNASHIAATILSAIPPRLVSERGRVLQKIDDSTFLIKTSSSSVTIKVNNGSLDAGEDVQLTRFGDEILIERKESGDSFHRPGNNQSADSLKLDTDPATAKLRAQIDTLSEQVQGKASSATYKEIEQIVKAVSQVLSGRDLKAQETIRSITQILSTVSSQSAPENTEKNRELSELLSLLKEQLQNRGKVEQTEATKAPVVVLKSGELKEGFYFFERVRDLASWPPYKEGRAKIDPSALIALAGEKGVAVRTMPSGNEETRAFVMSTRDAAGELAHFINSELKNVALKQLSLEDISVLLKSLDTLSFEELRAIDRFLVRAATTDQPPVTPSIHGAHNSLLQWITTALESRINLDLLPLSTPSVDASTIPVSFNQITELGETIGIEMKHYNEDQMFITESILSEGNKKELFQALIRQLGYMLEHDLAQVKSDIAEGERVGGSLKSELLHAGNIAETMSVGGEIDPSGVADKTGETVSEELSAIRMVLSRISGAINELSSKVSSVSNELLDRLPELKAEVLHTLVSGNASGSQDSIEQAVSGEIAAVQKNADQSDTIRVVEALVREIAFQTDSMIRQAEENRNSLLSALLGKIKHVADDILGKIEAILTTGSRAEEGGQISPESTNTDNTSSPPVKPESAPVQEIAGRVSEIIDSMPERLPQEMTHQAEKLVRKVENLLQIFSSRLPASQPQAASISFAEIEAVLLNAHRTIPRQLTESANDIKINLEDIMNRISRDIRELIERIENRIQSAPNQSMPADSAQTKEILGHIEKVLETLLSQLSLKTQTLQSETAAVFNTTIRDIEKAIQEMLATTRQSEIEFDKGALSNGSRQLAYYFSQQIDGLQKLSQSFNEQFDSLVQSLQQDTNAIKHENVSHLNHISGQLFPDKNSIPNENLSISSSQEYSNYHSPSESSAFSAPMETTRAGQIDKLFGQLIQDIRSIFTTFTEHLKNSPDSLQEQVGKIIERVGEQAESVLRNNAAGSAGSEGQKSFAASGEKPPQTSEFTHLLSQATQSAAGEDVSLRPHLENVIKNVLQQLDTLIRNLISTRENIEKGMVRNGEAVFRDMAKNLETLTRELSRHLETAQSERSNTGEKLPLEMFRQNVETALNRFESLQMLARPVTTAEGEQQMLAVPMKIQGEWTDIRVMIVKQHNKGRKKVSQQNYSVVINVAPSFLGEITARIEYLPRKSFNLKLEIENSTTRRWFEKNRGSLSDAFQELGFNFAKIDVSGLKKGSGGNSVFSNSVSQTKSDSAIDMRI